MNLSEEIIKHIQTNNNDKQLFYEGDFISAQEIIKKVNVLARNLISTSFTCDNRVLLVMKDSPEFIYSFLSLIKIGCIPVPLNPYITESELEHVLEDSRAEGIIIESEVYPHLKTTILSSAHIKKDKILLNTIDDTVTSNDILQEGQLLSTLFKKSNEEVNYYQKKSESIAFWQYTSGTTGKAKAVQHTQQVMLTNTQLLVKEKLKIDKSDRIMSISKMFFGYGLGNTLFFPLITGASVLVDRELFSVEKNNDHIATFKPTILFGVPKVYSQILHSKNKPSKAEIDTIRIFFSAGSALPESINKFWKKTFDKYIVNGVGCTELGHVFLCHDDINNINPKISGIPITGYDTKLVNPIDPDIDIEGNEVTGELCIAPPIDTLSNYWENPKANIVKYKREWYYSGDIFYKTKDNKYIYQGRKDDLFKINGKWVNPHKIEQEVLSLFPKVKECSMIETISEDDLSAAVLFLSYDKNKENQTLEEDIMNILPTRLHKHECPGRILFINEIPKNTNGKINRRELINVFEYGKWLQAN